MDDEAGTLLNFSRRVKGQTQVLTLPVKPFGFNRWLDKKSSETSQIQENVCILREKIIILLLETFAPDKINAALWLADDVITFYS